MFWGWSGGGVIPLCWDYMIRARDDMAGEKLSALFFLLFKIFIYLLYSATLGLCCARTFSICSKPGLVSSCGAWASCCGGFSCSGAQAVESVGFNSWGSQA